MSAAVAHRAAPLGTVDVLRGIDELLDRVDTGDVIGGAAAAAALREAERVITRLQAVCDCHWSRRRTGPRWLWTPA